MGDENSTIFRKIRKTPPLYNSLNNFIRRNRENLEILLNKIQGKLSLELFEIKDTPYTFCLSIYNTKEQIMSLNQDQENMAFLKILEHLSNIKRPDALYIDSKGDYYNNNYVEAIFYIRFTPDGVKDFIDLINGLKSSFYPVSTNNNIGIIDGNINSPLLVKSLRPIPLRIAFRTIRRGILGGLIAESYDYHVEYIFTIEKINDETINKIASRFLQNLPLEILSWKINPKEERIRDPRHPWLYEPRAYARYIRENITRKYSTEEIENSIIKLNSAFREETKWWDLIFDDLF